MGTNSALLPADETARLSFTPFLSIWTAYIITVQFHSENIDMDSTCQSCSNVTISHAYVCLGLCGLISWKVYVIGTPV